MEEVMFQFLYGAIQTAVQAVLLRAAEMFQFLYAAIQTLDQ